MRWRRVRSCSVSRIAALEGRGEIKEEEKKGLVMWANADGSRPTGGRQAPPPHRRDTSGTTTKALFSRASKPLYRGIDRWRTAHGDDHEWPNPTSCRQAGRLGKTQRPRSAQELHPRQRATRQDFGKRVPSHRHREGRTCQSAVERKGETLGSGSAEQLSHFRGRGGRRGRFREGRRQGVAERQRWGHAPDL